MSLVVGDVVGEFQTLYCLCCSVLLRSTFGAEFPGTNSMKWCTLKIISEFLVFQPQTTRMARLTVINVMRFTCIRRPLSNESEYCCRLSILLWIIIIIIISNISLDPFWMDMVNGITMVHVPVCLFQMLPRVSLVKIEILFFLHFYDWEVRSRRKPKVKCIHFVPLLSIINS